ncbi:MAG: DNA methylase [Oscillospiraceae bacterium]|nr:DNA methylase [Oscillospiraceae bacterium]
MKEKVYAVIDLKSFYASVECAERGLDPMDTNLVVADASRTEKTICLAVSPSLKAYGIPGRARLFEVIQKVREVNEKRRWNAPGRKFTGKSVYDSVLKENPSTELDYIIAPPRMAMYLKYSTEIYKIYLDYVSAEDIHVYSIDEVFIDLTNYLETYKKTAYELTKDIIYNVLWQTGITAAAGIGTNMYLAKVAMDIMAKHEEADEYGVRIAQLDEKTYREKLWAHQPITDFWRVGKGISKRLEKFDIYTMGDIAKMSIHNEDILYKELGINAELLIDHAWGWEPVTIADIKGYKLQAKSIASGQVLHSPYTFEKARVVLHEMADSVVYQLLDGELITDQMVLTVGYDIENISADSGYDGEIVIDRYGRKKPKHAHGTANLDRYTSSAKLITNAVLGLYDRITDKNLLIRRLTLVASHIKTEKELREEQQVQQLDLFSTVSSADVEKEHEALEKEKRLQKAVMNLKHKYGKNAVLKGMSFQEGATMRDRNRQIGGHRAGEEQ